MKRTAIVLGLIFLALTGCASLKEAAPVAVPVHDTLWRQLRQVDTCYIDRWHYTDRHGDTVRIADSVIVYRAKIILDTVREFREVPVEVVRTETVEVEKSLNLWQRLTMWLGNASLLAAAGIIVYRLWRRK